MSKVGSSLRRSWPMPTESVVALLSQISWRLHGSGFGLPGSLGSSLGPVSEISLPPPRPSWKPPLASPPEGGVAAGGAGSAAGSAGGAVSAGWAKADQEVRLATAKVAPKIRRFIWLGGSVIGLAR